MVNACDWSLACIYWIVILDIGELGNNSWVGNHTKLSLDFPRMKSMRKLRYNYMLIHAWILRKFQPPLWCTRDRKTTKVHIPYCFLRIGLTKIHLNVSLKCDNFHVRVEAIRCLEQAGVFYLELGRIAIAARHYKVHDYVDVDDNLKYLWRHSL